MRCETFESHGHGQCPHNVGIKKLYSKLIYLHGNDVSFLIEE